MSRSTLVWISIPRPIIQVKQKEKVVSNALGPYVASDWNQLTPFSCIILNGISCSVIRKGSNYVMWEPIDRHGAQNPTHIEIVSDNNGPYKIQHYSDGSQLWQRVI